MWARIRHQWADGTETEIEVGTELGAFPDESRECVARVLDMWAAVCSGAED